MKSFNEFLNQVFCKHKYKKIGWSQEIDEIHNVRYPMRYYKCEKCGKEIAVDGRFDHIKEEEEC